MVLVRICRPAVVRAVAAAAALAVLALAVGCTGSADPAPPAPPPPDPPFAVCPPSESPAAPPRGALVLTSTLPCFTTGEPVALGQLGRPAVINLWASWCEPCREELPALQAFADEVGDRLLVLGVATGDGRDAAAWAAIGFGVRYPNVFDEDGRLQAELGRTGLPITVFVAADGAVVATDVSGALTLEKLRALATSHLGLAP